MNDPHEMPDLHEARQRAAEIRRRWSPTERSRRVGLPPDAPWALLRTFFGVDRPANGREQLRDRRAWQLAPVSPRR
jgi:hypothetical protein